MTAAGDQMRKLVGDALKRALARVEARRIRGPIPVEYESPLHGKTAWHGTLDNPRRVFEKMDNPDAIRILAPWTQRGRPSLTRGEGFGLHVGTQSSAMDRVLNKFDSSYQIEPVFIDIVTRPGRAIYTDDLGHFGGLENWRNAFRSDAVRGLASSEKESLNALTEGLYSGRIPWVMPYGKRLRKALLGMGIDRVLYLNQMEDKGSESIALLDPRKVRWGSLAEFNPEREHWPNLLAGVGGALGTTALLQNQGRRPRA